MATLHTVPQGTLVLPEGYYGQDDDEIERFGLQSYARTLRGIAKRGDIVHFEDFGDYRNDGRFVWNGEELESLYFDYVDYGTIPPSYPVVYEFPLLYWTGSLNHNYVVYCDLSEELVNQVINNYNLWGVPVSFFYYNNKKYFIVGYDYFIKESSPEDIMDTFVTAVKEGIFEVILDYAHKDDIDWEIPSEILNELDVGFILYVRE